MESNPAQVRRNFVSGMAAILAIVFGLIGLGCYLYLEVSLNLTLVSLYSSGLNSLIEEYDELADHVELIGRIISGFGLSLGVAFLLPQRLLEKIPTKEVVSRLIAFIFLWGLSVPSLKIGVEHLVLDTTPQEKMASVRSLLFREALDRKLLRFDGAETLNQIVDDDDRRELLVAMLPSLALASSALDTTIEAKTEEMVLAMMERDQRSYFRDHVFPVYKHAWGEYDSEWVQYSESKATARRIRQDLTAPGVMEQKFTRLQKGIDERLAEEWLVYQTAFDQTDEYVAPLVSTWLPEFRKRTPRYKSSRCDRECRAVITNEWVSLLEFNRDQGHPRLDGIIFPDPDDWFVTKYIFGREIHLKVVFKQARERYLEARFPFDDDLEQTEFVNQPSMKKLVVEYAQSQGYKVPDEWERSDFRAIKFALQNQAQEEINKVWQTYQKNSQFKLVDRTMDKGEFSRSAAVKSMNRQVLGSLYFNGYSRSLSFDQLYGRWAEAEENVNFVRMLTDAAAEAAFSPGGIMYDLGIDAVRLSYIPPVAIVASLSAILMLLIRFGGYVKTKSAFVGNGYFGVIGLIALWATFNVVSAKASYANAMKEFGQQTVELKAPEMAVATLLGGVIDAESWLLKSFGEPNLNALASLFNGDQQTSPVRQAYGIVSGVEHEAYHFLSSLMSIKNDVGRGPEKPYDFNVAVIKVDEKVGLFAGLNYDSSGELSKVSIPNVLGSEDIGFLIEHRWIYRPDLLRDAYKVMQSVSSTEDWLNIKDVGKTSLRDELERRALLVMRDSDRRQIQRIHEAYAKGYNNLIFVQRNRGSLYDCYQMPKLTIENVAQLTTRQAVDGQKKFECKGELF